MIPFTSHFTTFQRPVKCAFDQPLSRALDAVQVALEACPDEDPERRAVLEARKAALEGLAFDDEEARTHFQDLLRVLLGLGQFLLALALGLHHFLNDFFHADYLPPYSSAQIRS